MPRAAKAAAGYGGNAGFFNKAGAEFLVGKPKFGDVGEHIEGALGLGKG